MNTTSLFLAVLEDKRRAYTSSDFPEVYGDHVAALRTALHNNNLTLCLGTGISSPNNVPSWPLLIERVARIALSDADFILFRQITNEKKDFSPLVLGRFLKASFTRTASLYRAIHSALYDSVDVSSPNDTIDALTDLASYCTSRSIQLTILTYNYDDLLEQKLSVVIPRQYDVIFDDETFLRSGKLIRVFHVHGYVPLSGASIRYRENIVLSEDEYHRLYVETSHWSNHVQAGRFSYSQCLFIGFSMLDPSVRRLIDAAIAPPRRQHHYCISTKTLPTKRYSKKKARFYDILTATALSDLGVSSIYVDSYAEIPMVIEQLKVPSRSQPMHVL